MLSREECKLRAYHYDLPRDLIALHPPEERTESKLLVYQAKGCGASSRQDRKFHEIVDFLQSGDLLILNDTRVSACRVGLKRASGGRVTALLLQELRDKSWSCLLSGQARLRQGERLCYDDVHSNSSTQEVEFIFYPPKTSGVPPCLLPVLVGTKKPAWQDRQEAEHWLLQYGETPIPPYLKRKAEAMDKERYQTVYANEGGSAAAPTAGLHFSQGLLQKIRAMGVEVVCIQLQIGYGTFAPLQPFHLSENRLHQESYSILAQTAEKLNQRQKEHRRFIAVGTSTLRALETNFRDHKGQFVHGNFTTDLFLQPPDHPRSIHGLVTNFHLPQSSLLLLVASYLGTEQTLSLYRYAIQQEYRFFSYGDAMLILK